MPKGKKSFKSVLCEGCLASGRQLTPIKQYLRLYIKLMEDVSCDQTKHEKVPQMCWECCSILRSVQEFQQQAKEAYESLVIGTDAINRTITLPTKPVKRHLLRSNLRATRNQPDYMEIEYCTEKEGSELNEIKSEIGSVEINPLSDVDERHFTDVLDNLDGAMNMSEEKSEGGSNRQSFNEDKAFDSLRCNKKYVGDPSCDSNLLLTVHETKINSVRKRKKNEKYLNIESKTDRKRKANTFLDSDNNAPVKSELSQNGRRVERQPKKKGVREKRVGKEDCKEIIDANEEKQPEKKKRRRRRLHDNLDRSVFSVTHLTLQQQVLEVEARQHLPSYTNARYKCNVCYRGFNIQHCYESHLVKHHEVSGAYACVVCRVRRTSEDLLRKHVTAVHTRQYSCKLCDFVSRHKGSANQHQNFHAGIIYQCQQCPMSSNNYTTYQNHVRIKHASRCVCALCGYMFASERGLHLHKKIKHRIVDALTIEGPYCAPCDVRFISQLAYDRHLKLSANHCSGDDPARISNDPQKMWVDERRSRSILHTRRTAVRIRSRSERVVSGPVRCEQCGRELANQRAYAHHFRTAHPHENRTQFPAATDNAMCELCGHVFRWHSTLMGHMWHEHGAGEWRPRPSQSPRPRQAPPAAYECPICAKHFTLKYNYQRHVFKHTGQRPYKCAECPKSFKSRGERRTHTDHVHRHKPWPKRKRTRKIKNDPDTSVINYVFNVDSNEGLGVNGEGAWVCDEEGLRENGALMLLDEDGDMTEAKNSVFIEECALEENDEDMVFCDEKAVELNEGASLCGDKGLEVIDERAPVFEEGLDMNDEGLGLIGEGLKNEALVLTDDCDLREENDYSVFLDEETGLGGDDRGVLFCDQEGLEQNYGGASEFGEEGGLGENDEGATAFYDGDKRLGENEEAPMFLDEYVWEDDTYVTEIVLEDENHSWDEEYAIS